MTDWRIGALVVSLALGVPGAAAVLASPAATASPKSPAELGPMDQQRVVQLAQAIEAQPLGERAKEIRAALIRYVVDAPDITVTVHARMLGDPSKFDKSEMSAIVIGQMMIAMAAYQIGHRTAKSTDVDVQVAGIEGALRAYENVRKANPAWKVEELERLLGARAGDKLAEHVRSVLAKEQLGK